THRRVCAAADPHRQGPRARGVLPLIPVDRVGQGQRVGAGHRDQAPRHVRHALRKGIDEDRVGRAVGAAVGGGERVLDLVAGPDHGTLRPARYGTTSGRGARKTVSVELSVPLLVVVSVYSISSPGRTTPPLSSTYDLWVAVKTGLRVATDVTKAPIR